MEKVANLGHRPKDVFALLNILIDHMRSNYLDTVIDA